MSCKSSHEILEATAKAGEQKCSMSFLSGVLMAFLAGAYIALGSFLALKTGNFFSVDLWGNVGRLAFAVVFPLGLLLVVVCGADLFTGNCLVLVTAGAKRSANWGRIACVGVVSWCGNFAGAAFVAYFMAYETGLAMDCTANIVNLANSKCSLEFSEAFWRGVGCNWLVCLALYAATAADDVMGKAIAIWFPVMGFVALGMEHCIANMFFVPLGLIVGSDVLYGVSPVAQNSLPELTASWSSFFIDNLLPVTLGNIVGGALFVAGSYLVIHRKRQESL